MQYINYPNGGLGGAGNVPVYPSLASFPTASFNGALAIADDTGIMYYYSVSALAWIPLSSGGSGTFVEKAYTLTPTDISNKYIVLPTVPSDPDEVVLLPVEGCPQKNGTDFEMTLDDGGKRLSWNGLGLDGILESTDTIIIIYS